ncbi:hypothetical protein ACIBSV_47965 [Embleya sp. NPDC050154]|uniref:hypothetical protein n=1 Tax=unclassified Embleya TaxID=2699296 RepID=UPI00378E7F61
MTSTTAHPAAATLARSPSRRTTRRTIRRFAPGSVREAGRRSMYALIALPLGLLSIGLVLGGRPARAARVRLAAARRFLDTKSDETTGRPGPGPLRVLRDGVLDAALGIPTLILAGYAYGNTLRNLTYPIWYGDTDYHDAWGGPTLAGVWTVHAIGGLAFFAVCLCLIKALTDVPATVARRTFGPRT